MPTLQRRWWQTIGLDVAHELGFLSDHGVSISDPDDSVRLIAPAEGSFRCMVKLEDELKTKRLARGRPWASIGRTLANPTGLGTSSEWTRNPPRLGIYRSHLNNPGIVSAGSNQVEWAPSH